MAGAPAMPPGSPTFASGTVPAMLREAFEQQDQEKTGTIKLSKLPAILEKMPAQSRQNLQKAVTTFATRPAAGAGVGEDPLVHYNPFLDWLFQSQSPSPRPAARTPAAGAGAKTVFAILPGLGDADLPGFPAEGPCPERLPDLSRHKSAAAEVLRQDPTIYERLRDKRTALGVSLGRCLKVGIDNPDALIPGIIAGDAECYDSFQELFDSVLRRCHGLQAADPLPPPVAAVASASPAGGSKATVAARFMVQVRMECTRNLSAFRFPPACDRDERRAVEAAVAAALEELTGEGLLGEYYPLAHSKSYARKPNGMTADEAAALSREHLLNKEPSQRVQLSQGLGRQWPEARGVFASKKKGFAAWCNKEDHIAMATYQDGPDLGAVAARMLEAHEMLQAALGKAGYKFAQSSRLGYLTVSPLKVGAGMRAYATLRLPAVSSKPDFIPKCAAMGLRATRVGKPGFWEVSNQFVLGRSADELVDSILTGCNELAAMEVAATSPRASVFKVLPGLGDSDYPGFPTDTCPATMPDLSKHKSCAADVLRADPAIYKSLKDGSTTRGATFARCVKPCFDLAGHTGMGAIAGDAECYTLFRPFFDPLLERWHQGCNLKTPHPRAFSPDAVSKLPIDPSGKHLIGVRLDCSRNLDGFRFPPACDQNERQEVERIIRDAFLALRQDGLDADYCPLPGSTTSTKMNEAANLEQFFFTEPGRDRLEDLSAGVGKQWPDARGVFVTRPRDLVAWCNWVDHLRVTTWQWAEEGTTVSLQAPFARLAKAMRSLEGRHSFAQQDRLGYLTAQPYNIGTALRATVTLHLPRLWNRPQQLREVCSRYRLRAVPAPLASAPFSRTRSPRPRPDVCQVMNIDTLGVSETTMVNNTIEGCAEMVRLDRELAGEATLQMRSSLQAHLKDWIQGDTMSVTSTEKLLRQAAPWLQQRELGMLLENLKRSGAPDGQIPVQCFAEWIFSGEDDGGAAVPLMSHAVPTGVGP